MRNALLTFVQLTFVLLTFVLLVAAAAARADERPNIVLVMADDQGWGDVAYNGHPTLVTPNLDAAAACGVRFDRFYAAAPVCSPTRAAVLTGRHPNRMGVFKWGYPMRPQETTIAEVLRAGGYATGHFGKWHLGSVRAASPAHPGANGFDAWLSAPNFFDNDPVLCREGQAVEMRGESSIVTARAAIAWMREQAKRESPFFAVVWFGSPHRPHRAVKRDLEPYADAPKKQRHFLGEITGIDRAFGEIRAALGAMGVRKNTILWYTSDNGALPKVGSTGGFRGRKGNVYDGGLLVPAFLEWPARVQKPRVTAMRGNSCDIFPTLLDAAGLRHPRVVPMDGVSLLPVIEGRVTSRTKPMGFWDFIAKGIGTPSDRWMRALLEAQRAGGDLEPHASSLAAAKLPSQPYPLDRFPGHAAWIDGDWKLHRIETAQGEVTWALHDLAADPHERADRAEAEPERVTAMRAPFERWLRSVVRSLNGEDYERTTD